MKTFARCCACAILTALPSLGGAEADSTPAHALRPIISAEVAPAVVLEARASDDHVATAVVRSPPTGDRLPAIVFFHGGLAEKSVDALRQDALLQPTSCRFLAAGYVTVNATFRARRADPQTRVALLDCLALVAAVKKLPRVDPASVVLFGGSGGGSLVLELAGETDVTAAAGGEPANVLFTGLMTRNSASLNDLMADPRKFYTPALQRFTEDKIAKIHCPLMIVHSDVHPINLINTEIVIPALRKAQKYHEIVFFPNETHGFYYGYHAGDGGWRAFEALVAFYARHLPTKPRSVNASLVKLEPFGRTGADTDGASVGRTARTHQDQERG